MGQSVSRCVSAAHLSGDLLVATATDSPAGTVQWLFHTLMPTIKYVKNSRIFPQAHYTFNTYETTMAGALQSDAALCRHHVVHVHALSRLLHAVHQHRHRRTTREQ